VGTASHHIRRHHDLEQGRRYDSNGVDDEVGRRTAWHDNAVNGKAYGFPYDDVGGYSSYISHASPQYMLVAIGW
jgi:Beta-1,3-glucanase